MSHQTINAMGLATIYLLWGCESSTPPNVSTNTSGGHSSDDAGTAPHLDAGGPMIWVEGELEVFASWDSEREQLAYEATRDLFREQYPVIGLSEVLNDEASQFDRFDQGIPPGILLTQSGSPLFGWNDRGLGLDTVVRVGGLDSDLALRFGWRENIPPGLLEINERDELLGLPVHTYRMNTVYYNKEVLNEYSLMYPDSLEALVILGEDLAELGYETPFCTGTLSSGALESLVFDSILVAVAGSDYPKTFWSGEGSPQDEAVSMALEYTLQIWTRTNSDAGELTPAEGLERLFLEGDNACALALAPGKERPALVDAGWEDGVQFDQLPFPATEDTFVSAGHSYARPLGGGYEAESRLWLEQMGSPEVQTRFAQTTGGSIPARTDVNPEEFSPGVQRQLADFATGSIVGSTRTLIKAGAMPDLDSVLGEMVATGDIGDALEYLETEYGSLH